MLHGPQQGIFDLEFRIPSECADRMASGAADIGIVPCFELTRQDLEIIPGAGIACHGPVRSILLVSKRPAAEIRTLAVDSSSRTSVQLARVILERRYGAEYTAIPHTPDLDGMLRVADAALIIGDPALRLDPEQLPYEVHDLGGEWVEMTGLPMVFAVWAAPEPTHPGLPELEDALVESVRAARAEPEQLAYESADRYGYPAGFLARYFEKLRYRFGPRERAGLYTFLEMARDVGELDDVPELRFVAATGATV